MNNDILIIAGPTASGKSALALHLAKLLKSPIINGDSLQLYGALPLLTAYPSEEDLKTAPHYLYGILDPWEQSHMYSWYEKASQKIHEAWRLNQRPLVVGGTGLYLRLISLGVSRIPLISSNVRLEVLNRLKQSPESFYEWVISIDPLIEGQLHENDTQRLSRAAEVMIATGQSIKIWQQQNKKLVEGNVKWIVLDPPRLDLCERIDRRFLQMLEKGAVDEVRKFLDDINKLGKNIGKTFSKVIGLAFIENYLKEEISYENMIEKAQTATKQYAKRQTTWFKNQIPSTDDQLRLNHLITQDNLQDTIALIYS